MGAGLERLLRVLTVAGLASERIVIESPLSFTGSAKRCWNWTKTDNAFVKWAVAVPVALGTIMALWTFILVWYMIAGIFVWPWRLLRRGSRKRKLQAAQHQELMARLDQQVAATLTTPSAMTPTKDS